MDFKHLKLVDRDDVVTVYFAAASILDESVIQQIGKEFTGVALEAAGERKLLLNFQGVKFMSSAMIGKIVRLHKQCKNDKITLKLCAIAPELLEVFTITRLDKILDIYDSEDKALASFKKRGFFR
ncbi:MAG: STAS domain-containing protein [Pirellulales bacterium]